MRSRPLWTWGQILTIRGLPAPGLPSPWLSWHHRGVPIVIVGVLLLVSAALVTMTSNPALAVPGMDTVGVQWWVLVAWLIAGAATAVLLCCRRRRGATGLLVAGAVLIGSAALAGPPRFSDDSARYAWDGIVTNAGVSPYAHPPVAAELARLRPLWLFPPVATGPDGRPACTTPGARLTRQLPDGAPLCTVINRPEVPTIYPPVAQGWFAAVRALVPREAPWWPMQVAGLLASLGVTAALIAGLRHRAMDERWAAVWAWSPFVSIEAVGNAHVDSLGVLFALAATLVLADSQHPPPRSGEGARPWLGGVLLGLAAATKLVPLMAAPPLLRRTPGRVLLAAAATVAAVYLPFVLAGGADVLGYLPTYLSEERYTDGSRFALVAALVPGPAATWVALTVLALAAALAWWRSDPAHPWHAQTVLAGTVLLVVNPLYPWYALTLVPFVALSRRWEWLAVPLALSVSEATAPRPWVLAVAAVVVAIGSVFRLVRGRTVGPEMEAV